MYSMLYLKAPNLSGTAARPSHQPHSSKPKDWHCYEKKHEIEYIHKNTVKTVNTVNTVKTVNLLSSY